MPSSVPLDGDDVELSADKGRRLLRGQRRTRTDKGKAKDDHLPHAGGMRPEFCRKSLLA
jgi:hypothetical protein